MELRDYPSTQKEAKATGAKFFLTGRPCVRGHIAPRYVSGSCTECKAEDRERKGAENATYFREWRDGNPERQKEYRRRAKENGYGKEYYQRNREEQIAKALEWARANPDKARQNVRNYHRRHKEKLSAKRAEYYRENRERILQKGQEYRDGIRAERAAAARRWRRENAEKARTMYRNKKLRRRNCEGRHTAEDVSRIIALQGGRCPECRASLAKGYHVDHIVPLAKGGTNWPSNIQALCPPCNLHKHATDPIEFARKKGRLL